MASLKPAFRPTETRHYRCEFQSDLRWRRRHTGCQQGRCVGPTGSNRKRASRARVVASVPIR